ncbi:hypothetical protein ACFVIM_06245 [Streptomyces sp. NPDC057638]|uniref:hypothetical protein n=1 Tax=Streptomyces sp. NPDC057638 TaxID=3346190 RepID=UPI003679A3CD
MWPGQQPPGGGDPEQNPYHQPGYHQPNPYQRQPGYGTVPPHQQPTPPYGAPQPPPAPPSRGGRTPLVIALATAVVVAAVVTGVMVLRESDDRPGSGEPLAAPSAPPTGAAPAPGAQPRSADDARPTVPGWKVVTNPRHGTRFDVPPDWEVERSGMSTGFEDERKGDGSPLITMSAPARLKSAWCVADTDQDGRAEEHGLATVGTKGGKGAKSTGQAAAQEAGNWVFAAYAQSEPGRVKAAPATPYTTASGLTGSVATATATGTRKANRCATDGKATAFTFKDPTGEFRTWVLFANAGIADELPDPTVRKILSTVRLTGGQGTSSP